MFGGLGCRLPAGNRDPAWVMRCTCAAPIPRLVAVPASCGGGLLGLLAPALLPLLLLVARRYLNSQGGDPRTPKVLRGALPRERAAQTARGGDPSTPMAAWPISWVVVWGPQDPKRPAGPPFSWGLVPYLALRAFAPVLLPAASAMSLCCCHDALARYKIAGLCQHCVRRAHSLRR